MNRKFLILSLLLSILILSSCNNGGGGSDGGGEGSKTFTQIPSKYVGTWVRDDLSGPNTDNKCDENYDSDGDGVSSATESQTAKLVITANEDANGLQYEWYMFMTGTGSGECSMSGVFFTDGATASTYDIEIISDSGTVLILKTKIGTNTRNLNGYSSIQTVMNAYNGSRGACGKTDWNIHGNNAADFQAGCEVVDGDDGMDDFKFVGSDFTVGKEIYWKLTNVDSTHMTFSASVDGGVTYDDASSLFLETP